jgi:hypothetical protein
MGCSKCKNIHRKRKNSRLFVNNSIPYKMAAAYFIMFHTDRALRRERVFRDRNNPLETMHDVDLIARYRFPRRDILEMTNAVQDQLERPTSRSSAIPPITQVSVF